MTFSLRFLCCFRSYLFSWECCDLITTRPWRCVHMVRRDCFVSRAYLDEPARAHDVCVCVTPRAIQWVG